MPSDLHLKALIASIREADEADRAELAALLRPHLTLAADPSGARSGRGWMSTKQAAEYLGMSTNALNKLASARLVPFEQEVHGGKRWFNAEDLDSWRRGRQAQERGLRAA